MEIISRENQLIKQYRRLSGEAKYRRETRLFVMEGARLCEDAVRSHVVIPTVFVTARARSQYAAEVAAVSAAAEQVIDIPDALAAYLSDTETPQGVFAVGQMPRCQDFPSPNGRYAALERIQDPGNLGTMIRTAEAFGLSGLFLSDGCCDPYSPKVLRSSMGGAFRLPLYAAGKLAETLPLLHVQGFTSYACVVNGGEAVQEMTFPVGAISVIGNEGNGLSEDTVSACSARVTIPMDGRAESLNASMAAGIVFWEMVRG